MLPRNYSTSATGGTTWEVAQLGIPNARQAASFLIKYAYYAKEGFVATSRVEVPAGIKLAIP